MRGQNLERKWSRAKRGCTSSDSLQPLFDDFMVERLNTFSALSHRIGSRAMLHQSATKPLFDLATAPPEDRFCGQLRDVTKILALQDLVAWSRLMPIRNHVFGWQSSQAVGRESSISLVRQPSPPCIFPPVGALQMVTYFQLDVFSSHFAKGRPPIRWSIRESVVLVLPVAVVTQTPYI